MGSLEIVSLPLLETLKTCKVLPKIVICLIKSTEGHITELSIVIIITLIENLLIQFVKIVQKSNILR